MSSFLARPLLAALLAASLLAPVAAAAPAVFSEKAIQAAATKNIGPQKPVAQQADRWARFKVSLTTDKPVYNIGDLMDITITSERDAYLVVFYVNSKGETSVICPSPFSTKNRVLANKPFKLLDNSGQALKQYGPTGYEQLQVLATEKPLDQNTINKIKAEANRPAPPAAKPKPQRPVVTASPQRPAVAVAPPPRPTVAPKPKPKPNKPPQRPTVPGVPDDEFGDAGGSTSGGGDSNEVGNPIPISESDEFVEEFTKTIGKMVAARSKEIASRYKALGPKTTFQLRDTVYGLAWAKYKVDP